MTDRDALVVRHLPLARRLARRFSAGAEPLEDLEQVAAIGLLKAVDRYDAGRGVAFTSYAVPTIIGEIKRHLRDHGWSLHVPRTLQNGILEIRTVERELLESRGHAATVAELADQLGRSVEAVLEVRAAAAATQVRSLQEPRQTPDGEIMLGDCLGATDPRLAAADDRLSLRTSMDGLPPRDRIILRLRFEHDLTQQDIASRCGLSQMHVSRIIRQSLERLSGLAQRSG